MPKPASIPATAPKKARIRAPRHYVATLHDDPNPVLIVAKSHKAAIDAFVKLTLATPADLLKAGKFDYTVIDTTADPTQVNLIDAVKNGAA